MTALRERLGVQSLRAGGFFAWWGHSLAAWLPRAWRNALGVEIPLPDPEMIKLILANTKVGKEELEDLAHERANAVKGYLIGNGKIAAERIFEKKDDIFKEPAKGDTSRSRVEINALAP